MFRDLTTEASLTRIEEEVPRFWQRQGVPEATGAARRDSLSGYQVYQQPLAVTGQPRVDQVRLLATADLFARYHTMKGGAAYCHTGWACHGLQVEVAVEQLLGDSPTTHDLAQFNAVCRDAALRGLEEGEWLHERLAVWRAPSKAYVTMTPQSISAVWGALRRLWDAGRLRHEHRIVSLCPRCATPLSSTEATHHTVEVETRAVWVHLPWDGEPGAYFLVWTPAPWTLLGMVALAAHPDADYVLIESAGRADCSPIRLLAAESALEQVPIGALKRIRSIKGKSLRAARYGPPFTFLPAGQQMHRVVLSKDVPLGQGSGLLPVTPGFDALSLELAQVHELPAPRILDDSGHLDDSVTLWRGLSPLQAEPLVLETLQSRGLLFREEPATGLRARCPYCGTALLSLSRPVWLVETGSGDWVVGRERAWGTPLPVWLCERCGDELCLAGLDDLAHRTGLVVDQIEPHRPAVDRLTFPCDKCSGTMQRIAAVVDAGFEAAILPLSTAPGPGPADLAVGLGEKQVGWLADLGELSALLWGSPAWNQAVALSMTRPEKAWDQDHLPPASALRWAVYAGMTPDQAERGFLRSLRQLVAALTGPEALSVPSQRPPVQELLDRWLEARAQQVIAVVTEALDACQPQRAAKELADFVSDLAGWYVPLRSGGGGKVLETLSQLLAPFTPHLAEAIHRHISGWTADSIHATAWPVPDPARIDLALLAEMAQVRRLAALGQVARDQAQVAPERMLPLALVHSLKQDLKEVEKLSPLQDLMAEVLKVAQVRLTPEAGGHVTWHLSLTPGLAAKRDASPAEIEATFAALEPHLAAELVSQLWDGLSVSLEVAGQATTLLPDEVSISAQAQPGWAAAADAELLVVLDVG
jgi:isoleucyl-tRNA synthetase